MELFICIGSIRAIRKKPLLNIFYVKHVAKSSAE